MTGGLHRRRFLTASLGFAIGAGSLPRLLSGSDSGSIKTFHCRAFGTRVSLSILSENAELANTVFHAARSELRRIEEVMSLYQEDSQIVRLNQEKRLDYPDARLVEVLQFALTLSARSKGAFDVTVQPLWELYSHSKSLERVVENGQFLQAREAVDWRRIQILESSIRFTGQETKITLNGIAQGYAVDRILRICRDHGIQHALLDCGEIGALGNNSEGRPWKIGLQHPRDPEAYATLARSDGRCLSTSGDYATPFKPDYSLHHIFDPRTGGSPAELASVTVAARSGMLADALSTTVIVLGVDEGLKLLQEYKEADAFLISKSGKRFKTPGFPS